MGSVIAGKVGLGGDPQSVAQARPCNEVLLVNAAALRGPVAPTDRNGQGIALDGIDRQPQAQIPRQQWRIAAERQNIDVGFQVARAGHDLFNGMAVADEALDGGIPAEVYPAITLKL